MTTPKTECIAQTTLPFYPQLPVVVQFDAPEISSDGGALLLREMDERLEITKGFAACLPDDRDPQKVKHSRHEQTRQRIFQIALGYEDCNDAERLRHDPVLKTVCDQTPKGESLSSQPTLSRFENTPDRRSLCRLVRWFERQYIASLSPNQEVVILDIDSTDDETHGQQELSFFHGYYDHHIYHPLLVYDGEGGQLITAILRPGNHHDSRGAKGLLRRLIRKIRHRCPQAAIVVRGDAGFCSPKIFRALERLDGEVGGVDYLFGMAKNPRLIKSLDPVMQEAKERQCGSGKEVIYTSFDYAAKSWTKSRLIIGKAEYSPFGPNPRFVLTSLKGFDPETLYKAYCERGRCELWIKDLKRGLAADRLSCSRFRANFFRLLLHAAAYRLMYGLRGKMAHFSAKFGRAQFDTIRLHLLRVAAVVTQSVRRISIRLPKAFPQALLFHKMLESFSLSPPPTPS